VLRVVAVAERVLDDIVGQDPGMPGRSQSVHAFSAAGGLVDGGHAIGFFQNPEDARRA
jgi:hypothetical protein